MPVLLGYGRYGHLVNSKRDGRWHAPHKRVGSSWNTGKVAASKSTRTKTAGLHTEYRGLSGLAAISNLGLHFQGVYFPPQKNEKEGETK